MSWRRSKRTGQLRRHDRLAQVALGVLGQVDGEADDGRRQPCAADLAGVAQTGGIERRDDRAGTLEARVHLRQQLVPARGVRGAPAAASRSSREYNGPLSTRGYDSLPVALFKKDTALLKKTAPF